MDQAIGSSRGRRSDFSPPCQAAQRMSRMRSMPAMSRDAYALALAIGLTGAIAPVWAMPPEADGLEFFEKNIRPVLVTHCYACHSAQAPKVKGGLLLDTRAGIRKGGE